MVFLSALSQCFSFKRRLFCENQPIFVCHLPIDFFYFEDFRWPFFGKITGQKRLIFFTSSFIEDSLLLNIKWNK